MAFSLIIYFTKYWYCFLFHAQVSIGILFISEFDLISKIYRRGIIKQFCPIKNKDHDLLGPPLPPAPIRSEDLPAEYILRHRDSDYQFTQEFEVATIIAFYEISKIYLIDVAPRQEFGSYYQ